MKDEYGQLISSLAQVNDKKIVMLVLDGLGDIDNKGKGTALQMARTPNMDKLAQKAALGLAHPVFPGISPGSGPGHLGLFGYDPVIYQIGRGVLSALGLEFKLLKGDVAARLNFCTLDKEGKVEDRRAGRISSEKNKELIEKIKKNLQTDDDVEVFFETESEHRALMVLRGEDLDDKVGDTDPQQTGKKPLDPTNPPYDDSKTAKIARDIFEQVREILKDESPANMILSRGFAQLPDWPPFHERYRLNPVAVAGYPMYRGIARLLGMEVFSEPKTPKDIISETVSAMKKHDFVFTHFKDPDKTGENGDIQEKIKALEAMDEALPELIGNEPDVLIITGDHSTPAPLSAHSWHPVPVLLKAPGLRGPFLKSFDEITALKGELGTISSKEIITLAMAHAGKLAKFGA
ncbi:MAG: 2,3-bisphosphoglycerate-independent phosphoglycerate mutase [Bacteroidales bacterium]